MPKQTVTLATAQKLTPSQLAKVRAMIKRKIGSFTLVQEVDPNILGGVKIRIGNQEFDASIAGKLERLESTLPQVRVVTVVPLNDKQRSRINKFVDEQFGSVTLIEEIDPQIIGGIKIITNSIELDGSIKGKLDKLKTKMIANI